MGHFDKPVDKKYYCRFNIVPDSDAQFKKKCGEFVKKTNKIFFSVSKSKTFVEMLKENI